MNLITDMQDKALLLLLFPNVHKVMKADRIFHEQNIFCRVIPVPEHISSECGMCLLVDSENMDLCTKILEEKNIQFEIHKQDI